MIDEEIEFALKQYAIGGGRNVVNMDWAGTLDYINRLKADIEKLKQSDKSKEDCTIEQHGEIHRLRDKVKQIRKDTAQEILNAVDSESNGQTISITNCIRRKYGVEIEK